MLTICHWKRLLPPPPCILSYLLSTLVFMFMIFRQKRLHSLIVLFCFLLYVHLGHKGMPPEPLHFNIEYFLLMLVVPVGFHVHDMSSESFAFQHRIIYSCSCWSSRSRYAVGSICIPAFICFDSCLLFMLVFMLTICRRKHLIFGWSCFGSCLLILLAFMFAIYRPKRLHSCIKLF